jgi:hypothetical protein
VTSFLPFHLHTELYAPSCHLPFTYTFKTSGILSSSILKTCIYHPTIFYVNLPSKAFIFKFCFFTYLPFWFSLLLKICSLLPLL